MRRADRRALGSINKPWAKSIGMEPKHLLLPLRDAYQELAIQFEASEVQALIFEGHMQTAKEIIESPEYQAKLKAMLEDTAIACLRTPTFSRDVDAMVKKAVEDIAVDILAEHLKEAESKVRAIVERDWEARVTKVAHDLLDAKLADLRRSIAR
jgi:hypothetical protein